MLCNVCNKNQASVHLTEIIDDHMSELHLCDECARKKSMQMEQQFGLSDLLAGLVEYGKQFGTSEKEAATLKCDFCGLTYEDFRKIGRFGCSECYSSFAKYLAPLLKRIHGANQHVGKASSPSTETGIKGETAKSDAEIVADLKAKLVQAIEREEFEEAARYRDAIKEAEAKGSEREKYKDLGKKKKVKKDNLGKE